ncbi:UNVERIFIED_CONTAM: hypothetical protein GTU68_051187 [Idotea baltica]|nr:hypothetical protein [Idotea baltica]
MVDLILKKRSGQALTEAEIHWFVQGFAKDEIPDYQVSSLMMAIFFQGMDKVETAELVRAMIASGDVIDLSGIAGKKVDKHSTGGVGDKTSIVLGPMVAACGVPVAKLSGRGLGHTGGTLDKLEAFDNFQVELDMETFVKNVNDCGIAIVSQTANLVPADKQLYALRDVTGTVENRSLIAGSIMSKKLASGADAIVLDVKTGSGAFMKTKEDAFDLARAMVDIGIEMGKRCIAVVSDMEQPLGRTVGNTLEVQEAIATLKGEGPSDLEDLCLELGAYMLVLSEVASDAVAAKAQLRAVLKDGSALAKLRELVVAQGGNPNQVDNPETLPGADHRKLVLASESGYVQALEAVEVGRASMQLGAGRETKSSIIDLGAGIVLHKKVGEWVETGDPIAELYTNDAERLVGAEKTLTAAYTIGGEAPTPRPLVHGIVE